MKAKFVRKQADKRKLNAEDNGNGFTAISAMLHKLT